MVKKALFSIIATALVLLILSPTIISFVDVKNEIMIVLENTEEENNTLESAKELEIDYLFLKDLSAAFVDIRQQKNIQFRDKNYTSLSLDLVSPPPEIVQYS